MHYLIVVIIAFALSMMGCEGKTGPAGPQGSTGAAGPAGPAGADGSPGATGPAGPQGEKGDTGAAGPMGEAGPPGEPGPEGPMGPEGPAGPMGPEGPAGPAGPQGEQGPEGPQGPGAEPGGLAAVHHVVLIQDGQDEDDARRYSAPGFDDDRADVNLIVKGSTMFVAKAGTQSGSPIDVDFAWESSDEAVATVMADGASATITGIRKGESTITVSIAERGVEVELMVEVHNAVKSIVITGPDGAHAIDTVLPGYKAVAHDDMGDTVPDQMFMWDSNTAAATVTKDDDDSSMATVEISGEGEANITASIGDVISNVITVTGFSVEQPRRQLVINPSALPIAVTMNSDSTAVTGSAAITITLQQWGLDATDNELKWINITTDQDVTFKSLNTDVLTIHADPITTSSSDATLTINRTVDAELTADNAVVKMVGTADVKVTAEYADPLYVRVTVKEYVAP